MGAVTRRLTGWTRISREPADDRRVWWTVFTLFLFVTVCWSVATPVFGAPDEPAHAIRAVSVVRGQILGDEPKHEPRNPFTLVPHGLRGALGVQIPPVWNEWVNVDCYAFRKDVPADCLSFSGPADHDETVYTTAGKHPPAYYAVVGLPTLVRSGGSVAVYLMRVVNAAITSALLASAVLTARRTPAPALATLGVLLAATPMVLFLGGVVNPSGVEIAAAIAVWIGAAVLVREAPERVDPRLVARVGVATTILVLVRSISPFWAVAIALVLCLLATRDGLRRIARERVVRIWGLVVVGAGLAQLVWVLVVGTLDAAAFGSGTNDSTSEIARNVVGKELRLLREMIGFFGWLDTPAPALTLVLWIVVLGGIVALALALGRGIYARALLAALTLTVLVPMVAEARAVHDAGYYWQGRYTLPIAVGLPVLAGLALADRDGVLEHARRWLVFAGASIAVAQVLAFGQALRRYTVGYDGTVLFFTKARWEPPIPSLLLLLAFAGGIAALVWCTCRDPRPRLPALARPPANA